MIITLSLFSCKKKEGVGVVSSEEIKNYIANSKNENFDDSLRIEYNNKSLYLLSKNKNTTFNRKLLLEVANTYYKLYKNDKLKETCLLLAESAKKANDSIILGKAYNFLGKHKLDENELDSSFYFYIKAEKIFIKKKDSINLSVNYLDKSLVQFYVNAFLDSEYSSIQSLLYQGKKEDLQKKYDAYNLLGVNSNENKNFDNAVNYHLKAINILEENPYLNKNYNLVKSYNNIGFVYQNLNENTEAIKYFKKGLKQKLLFSENPNLFAMLIDNYAYSKFKLNDFSELPGLFYKSLKIREEKNINQGIVVNKIHLSEYYSYLNDTINSKKFASEALKLAKSTKISGSILISLKQMSTVDKKNSTQFYKEYIRLSDSVQNEERKAKDRFARIAYETDEIIQQKSELEVENRNLIYYLFASAGIFALLYVVRSQKAKNRELALKQQQQEVNEEIYNLMISQQATIEESRADEKKRMAQELHDGVLSKMFGTRLNLDSLNDAKDKDSIDRRYTYIQELKNIEQEIREISHDLSREKEKLINNFVGIVLNLLEEQKNSFTTELTYSFDKNIKWDMLNNTAKINLYRILQETLQNCNKYAKAKAINVDFKSEDENIVLTVSDDGSGFDLNKKKKGIGLKNMVARAEESGGKYEINSVIDQGTSTTVIIPLNAPKPNQT